MKREYTQEQLEMAISNVVDGGLGIRETANKFKIPFTTLHRRVNSDDHSSKFMRPGVKPVLSEEEESHLTEAVCAFQEIGFGLTRKDVLLIAKQVDDSKPPAEQKFLNSLPTNGWFRRFSGRHNLVLRCPQNKSAARWDMENPEARDSLFNLLENLIEKYGISSTDIYNMDETGLQIVTKHPKIITKKGTKNVYTRTGGERSETISLAVCANASGTVILPPFIIFKGLSLSANLDPEQYPPGSIFSHSKSGYMVRDLFEAWMEVFIRNIPARRPVLLIFDGDVSHLSYNVLLLAKKNNVILLCLPPHTSHLYQPLDVGVFRPLKCHFQEAVARKSKKKIISKVTKKNFGSVLAEAWDNAIIPKNIKGGFRKAGIWPINRLAAEEKQTARSIANGSPMSPSTSNAPVPTPATTPVKSNTVEGIIKEMFQQIPEITPSNKSRRIKIARCLTTDEYISQVKSDEEKRLKKSLPKKSKTKAETTPDSAGQSSKKNKTTQKQASFREIQLAEEEQDDIGLSPKEDIFSNRINSEVPGAVGAKRKAMGRGVSNKKAKMNPNQTSRYPKRKPR